MPRRHNLLPRTVRGALVRKSVDLTGVNVVSGPMVAWDQEAYDTDSIHDNVTNNSRLTVPGGVTWVRLSAQVRYLNGTAGELAALAIYKNGVGYDGQAYQVVNSPTGAGCVNVSTGVIPVVAGQYFEASFQVGADTSVDINAALSWFAMEIVA